jgi:peptidyl-prolyl cis-trans isomerase B (cyclophilin B)
MRKYLWLALILFASILIASCGSKKKQEQTSVPADTISSSLSDIEPEYAKSAAGNPIVVLKTSKGDIEIEVFEKVSPNHGGNFIKLVKNGFYDGLFFHKVIPDLLIESGDPSGTGAGGPGYSLEAEQTPYQNRAGYVGMLSAAEGKSNGSQFYILIADNPEMDGANYCFGKVATGIEIALAISKVPVQKEKPIEPMKIIEAYLKPASTSFGIAADDSSK